MNTNPFKVGDRVKVRDECKSILNPSKLSDCAGLTGTVRIVIDTPIYGMDTVIEYDKDHDTGAFAHTELELI